MDGDGACCNAGCRRSDAARGGREALVGTLCKGSRARTAPVGVAVLILAVSQTELWAGEEVVSTDVRGHWRRSASGWGSLCVVASGKMLRREDSGTRVK